MFSGVAAFGIGLIIAFIYLLLHVWKIFGIWNVLGMSLLFSFFVVASRILGFKRIQTKVAIVYNPNEVPMYIGTFLGFGTIWYLYKVMNSTPELSSDDFYMGMAFLSINTWKIAKECLDVFRHRNDHVEITDRCIHWVDIQDGKDRGCTLSWSNVQMIRPKEKSIEFTMTDREIYLLSPSQMNMGPSFQLLQDILSAFDEYKDKVDVIVDSEPVED